MDKYKQGLEMLSGLSNGLAKEIGCIDSLLPPDKLTKEGRRARRAEKNRLLKEVLDSFFDKYEKMRPSLP